MLTDEKFKLAKAWIIAQAKHAAIEMRMFEKWRAGSRTAVYSALSKDSFEACSLTEKVIIVEAVGMMSESAIHDNIPT